MRDADIRAFLTELYETGQQSDAQEQERRKKMLNLEPETAQFLNMLIRSSRRVGCLKLALPKCSSATVLAHAKTGPGCAAPSR